MTTLLTLLIGALGGVFIKTLTMKIDFRHKVVDHKYKVYDSIIITWVKMRNFILHELLTDPPDPNKIYEFDKMYGESQAFIGEAVLVSDNYELTEKINQLNEDFYRTDWKHLLLTSGDLGKVNPELEEIKLKAFGIINEMRADIQKSLVFTRGDFLNIVSMGLWRQKVAGGAE